jgi:hypothetical protein
LLWGKKLSQLPVIIESTKLGFKLNTNTMTLLVLAALMIVFLIAFRGINYYEEREQKLKNDLDQAGAKITMMETFLDRFRSYVILFRLVFPETEKINAGAIKTQVYICKQGQESSQLTEAERTLGFLNDIWIRVQNLNPGDKLKIIAQEGDGRFWESTGVVEIPKSDLSMRRVTK